MRCLMIETVALPGSLDCFRWTAFRSFVCLIACCVLFYVVLSCDFQQK